MSPMMSPEPDITGSTSIIASGADIVGSGDIIGDFTPIIGLRRPQGDEWLTEDWPAYFDERAAIAEFDVALRRPEAEELAFDCCVPE